MKNVFCCALLLCCATSLADEQAASDQLTAEQLAFFETKIRPVLVESCYECHSEKAAQAGNLESGLLVDSREASRKGGESGPAVVPGDPESSLLIRAIRHDSFEMPPTTRLPQDVIDDFVKWVEMGAPDPRGGNVAIPTQKEIDVAAGKQFWSFQPLQQTVPPAVANTDWPTTDVDRYIRAKLEENGIDPNDAADRKTLIRRLYFDVWGLPPAPADVRAFVDNQSPDAYEELIDRLLAGGHYGERWARHWLDLARFAESNGYAFDQPRPTAFHYRDFVIKALNEDMSYDEFVRWQVAGDLIAPQSYMAQAATGFLAAGPFTTQQTMKERERSRYEQLDDIIGTLGTSMLGLTVACARCHDHKFDPVGHQDYYRLVANFAEVGFQDFPWDPNPEESRTAAAAFDNTHQPFIDARTRYERQSLPGQLAMWETRRAEGQPDPELSHWHHIGPFTVANYEAGFDEQFEPEKQVDLTTPVGESSWTPRPEWTDGTVHNTLLGNNAVHYLYRTIDVPEHMILDVSLGSNDGLEVFLNGKEMLSDTTIGAAAADEHILSLLFSAGRNELLLKIVNGGGPAGFYFKAGGLLIPEKIERVLQLTQDKRSQAERQELLKWFGPRDIGWTKLHQAEQEHLAGRPKPNLTQIYAARTGGNTYDFGDGTRKVYFLARGNSNSKTGRATPAYLRVLMNSDDRENAWLASAADQQGIKPPRIALGDWLTDTQQGAGQLLARVIVNRLWQHHFGRGIVATPSDFGTQGMPPTHPELLDYLAIQLVEGGWKLKRIHKLILMSAVYRQSTETNPVSSKEDPDNQLWGRRSSQRLDAEIIRDNLLAVSGSLDETMFGAGSLDEADLRRSVYLMVKRGELIPLLQLFDAPDGMQGIGNRSVTTVPPQALAMMNSPLVREQAAQLAERVRQDGAESPDQIVENTFWTTLSRPPEPQEAEQMKRFIVSQADRYGNDESALTQAIEDYCQLMLCLNEFVYVD